MDFLVAGGRVRRTGAGEPEQKETEYQLQDCLMLNNSKTSIAEIVYGASC